MWSALPAVSLDSLIVSGPVERGFYVGVENGDMAAAVSKKLVELMDTEHDTSGDPGLQHAGMTAKLNYSQTRHWRRNSRIGQLIWVDSGNRFDPYYMSVEAKKRKLDPVRVLRAVKVGRPFTAFQYQQMLEKIPNPALWASDGGVAIQPGRTRDEGLKNSQAVWWTPLVVISDLMGLFYDPDLPEDALIRAFRSFMIRLTFLRQRAIVLALLREGDVPPNRRHLLPDVLKLARRVYAQEPARIAGPASRLMGIAA